MARGSARLTSSISRFIYFYLSVSFAWSADYGIPIEIKVWDNGRTPLAHVVDITNGFGLRVLAEHNFLNDNNMAFSPYGLMGILVALYEGVDGESSYQIQRGMQLPWNRNVMRIGFRDIHRTLKTYFVPEEGFLAGLALNNENVTFNESYKKILQFYGFDLDNDQIPTLIPDSNDTISMSTSTEQSPHSTANSNAPTTMTMTESVSTISTKEETTLNTVAETVEDIDPRGPTSTSVTSSATTNGESTTALVTENTTFQSTTSGQSTSTETNNAMPSPSSTIQITSTTSTASEVATTPTAQTTSEATTLATSPPSSITITGAVDTDNLSTREMSSLPVSDSTTIDVVDSSTTTTQITNQQTESTVSGIITETSEASSTSVTSTTSNSEGEQTDSTTASILETLERRKRSLIDYGMFTKAPLIDDYLIYRSFDIPSEPVNTELNTKMFLVNGLRNVQVSYMHYDTVLEHAYLPHLEASALRLPLDSERYYLLVVLPSRRDDLELGRLLARMGRESDLSDVYAALRPRRVRAIVPSFIVKGHVTLTTDLQKLGIRDVFEPRQHDFTPMTRQPGVYVRSIEQAVSVAIRKYQADDLKPNRYVTNRNRVFFSATYPFLYFVMDSSIHVALMAGKMVDPLNTRIL